MSNCKPFGLSQTEELLWQLKLAIDALSTGGGGAVASVFGRTGIVTAQASDYASFYTQKPVKVNNPLLTSNGTTATWSITNTLGDDTVIPVLINNSTNEQVGMFPIITASTITYVFTTALNIAANTYRVAYIGNKMSITPTNSFTYTLPFTLA